MFDNYDEKFSKSTSVDSDCEAECLKLSPLEFAFYTTVANNDSARELMQQDKWRELAVVLLQ